MIIVYLLYLDNKDLTEIQLNVIFTETANLAKGAKDIIGNLVMMTKKKELQ